jgi:hypothetical protein
LEVPAINMAIQPATHSQPTRLDLTNPTTDLTAYIEAIPKAVYIENVEFTVNNTVAFTDQNLLAEIHANRDADDAKFNHLVQLVSNQFT